MSLANTQPAFPALAKTVAAALNAPELPLSRAAEALWQSEYSVLLHQKPWLFPEGCERALSHAKRWAQLVASESRATAIDADAMRIGLALWQYAEFPPRSAISARHGVSCDNTKRTILWNGKQCSLIRAKERFRLFRAFLNANGKALDALSISDHIGKKTTMDDEALRRAVSHLRKSLRKAGMEPLADAVKSVPGVRGAYAFRWGC